MPNTLSLPKYDDLFKPTLEVLTKLGGSGSIEEVNEAMIAAIGASQEQLDVTYPKSGAAVLPDRMSWARSFLKLAGFMGNPKRGVWVLTEEGRTAANKSNVELKKFVNTAYKASLAAKKAAQAMDKGEDGQDVEDGDGTVGWSDLLLQRVQTIAPTAFERLSQRLLRESGFIRVEVSGKSGDGGIDGVGVLRVNLISFQVLFQCKRWKGSVGSEVIRNFRGAMQGRADKGLIITTGTFTAEARKEATRDGAPAIDLIDGEALCGLMKDLGLGVHVRQVHVEEVTLNEEFFEAI
jgi:restriction system protein